MQLTANYNTTITARERKEVQKKAGGQVIHAKTICYGHEAEGLFW